MEQAEQQQTQEQPSDQDFHGMMGQRWMMGRGMRIIFALMDSDGDGTISLQEYQAAQERIFKAMDANKDGRVTLEEMQAFMWGARRSVPQ